MAIACDDAQEEEEEMKKRFRQAQRSGRETMVHVGVVGEFKLDFDDF